MGLKPHGYEGKTTSDGVVLSDTPRGMTVKEAKKTKGFWMLFAALSLGSLASTWIFINAYLQTPMVGYTIIAAGAYVSAQSLGQTVGKASLGTLSDIISPKKVVFICYFLQLIGVLCACFLADKISPIVISIFGFVIGISSVSSNLVWPLCAKEAFGSLEYTAVWANLARALSMVGAFSSTLWGMLIDIANGDYRVAFIGGSILLLVPFTVAFTVGKVTKDYPLQWHE